MCNNSGQYIFMYAYMCICMYLCLWIYIYIMWVRIYVYMCIFLYICTYLWILYIYLYMYSCEYLSIYVYSKTSLTDHIHTSTTPLYRSLYFGPKRKILYLPKQTTSLNGPLKVSPIDGQFREVLLIQTYFCICVYLDIHIHCRELY